MKLNTCKKEKKKGEIQMNDNIRHQVENWTSFQDKEKINK